MESRKTDRTDSSDYIRSRKPPRRDDLRSCPAPTSRTQRRRHFGARHHLSHPPPSPPCAGRLPPDRHPRRTQFHCILLYRLRQRNNPVPHSLGPVSAAALTAAALAPLHASPTSMGAWHVPASKMPAWGSSTGRSFGWTSKETDPCPPAVSSYSPSSEMPVGSMPVARTTRSAGTSTASPKVSVPLTVTRSG